jgi:hypothetical protein
MKLIHTDNSNVNVLFQTETAIVFSKKNVASRKYRRFISETSRMFFNIFIESTITARIPTDSNMITNGFNRSIISSFSHE